MFKRFLVATDLSPASSAMVNCLGGLKTYGSRECLCLLCMNTQEAVNTAAYLSPPPLLEVQKRALEGAGYKVEPRNIAGNPKKEITRIAAKEDFGLIVLGT